jgi:hypothetical protein
VSGPFIVSRHAPIQGRVGKLPVVPRVLSMKAVADVGAMQRAAIGAIADAAAADEAGRGYPDAVDAVFNLGPEGGTVRLPDGSEIHVEATNWLKLRGETGMYGRYSRADVIAEWNRRFGVAAQEEGES